MTPRCLVALVLAAALGASALEGQRPESFGPGVREFIEVDAPLVAITNVRLIDGTGSDAREGQTVVMRDGRIEAVGPAVEVPTGAETIDGTGMTLMPGFVMTHEHMFYVSGGGRYNTQSASFPPLYLAGGVTTMRTAGSMEPYTDMKLRDWISEGRVPGPTMDVTGPYLEGEGLAIPSVHGAEGPDEIRDMVRYWAGAGVTSFKVYNLLSREMLAAAVEEAHARGLRVTGHLCSITYREAVDLGIDHLEHGFRAATDWVADKEPDACPGGASRSLLELDLESPAFRDLVDHLVRNEVAITATPTVFEISTPGRPPASEGARAALLPEMREAYLSRWERVQAQGEDSPAATLFEKGMAMNRAFFEAGGLLTLGTDPTGYGGVVAGYANIRAVQLLAEFGFTAEEAVLVATLNGARSLGMDADIGSVEVGKRADLVLVRGDPTADRAAFAAVELVFKDGVGYDSRALFRSVEGTVGLR